MTKQRGLYRNIRRRATRSTTCAVESLETRRLLASIAASVFHDVNGNGVMNPGQGDSWAQNYFVYVDTNENGEFDEGVDFGQYTNESGNVLFTGLDPLTEYHIGVAPRADGDGNPLEGVSTGSDVVTVTTGAVGSTTDAGDFGIARSRITGRVFIDENNNNTYDAGEGRGAIRVFLDLNGNGLLDAGEPERWTAPTFLTDGITPNPNAGNYVFDQLDAGEYDVRVFPAHYQTVIGDNPVQVDLAPAFVHGSVDFGLQNLSSIGGVVRDASNQLISNARVYADLNNNGQFDVGEPSALSFSSLTPQGINYFIEAIDPGTYTVRVQLPAGYTSSTPASQNVTVGAGQETFNTNFTLTPDGTTPPPPPPGDVVNDFNGDGKEDIIVTQSGFNTVWFMDGTTRLGTAAAPHLGAGFTLAGYGDFDGDGKPDLVAYHAQTGILRIMTLDGLTVTGMTRVGVVGNLDWAPVGVGDFNGDGNLDIVWRNQTTGQNTTWRMDGLTLDSFKALPSTADLNWYVAGVGDFNNDGTQDIVWRHAVNGRNTAWLMSGTGAPTFQALPSTADQNWRPVAIANFNDDDIPDILWIHSQTGANSVWLMTGGQPNFSKVTL